MDDRRRTISSEEQMIGEALMRVSNTLEAQRLTKSLDYQEKLRSRSNIRLIIAIICLFTAMMMMMISGALLFVLWRYADPVLDVVMPFLKNVMADFGVIWDGLVESLSYVPVMVEQLTRLLEQVIIMLEGINSIDLAGLMGYLSKMLGGLMTMMDDLRAALAPMMDALGNMLQTLSLEGIDGVIVDLFGEDAAANIQSFMKGMMDMLGGAGKTFAGLGNAMGALGDSLSENVNQSDIDALVQAMGGALKDAGASISENLNKENLDKLITGIGDFSSGAGTALSGLGSTLAGLANKSLIEIIKDLLGL
ncbi:MAG: hypothetical protein MJ115_02335 [Clostridia bacterium]|nr:hypothetical protein [Clostridia bacterium]